MLGTQEVPPIVWQHEWCEEIRALFNNGSLTINDLELAGMVLGWLVADDTFPSLEFKHIGIFADNTSAIAWLTKGSTTTSVAAGALLRFLHLRIRERRASSFIPIHIPGLQNDMADISSRAFKTGKYFKAHSNLEPYFNLHFKQSQSWNVYHHPKEWVSRVTSLLRGIQSPLGSLQRLPQKGRNTGGTGLITAKICRLIQHSKDAQKFKPSSPPLLSALGSGQVATAGAAVLKFQPFLRPYRPSPRPWNWLAQKVPSNKLRTSTSLQSNECSKALDAPTPPTFHN